MTDMITLFSKLTKVRKHDYGRLYPIVNAIVAGSKHKVLAYGNNATGNMLHVLGILKFNIKFGAGKITITTENDTGGIEDCVKVWDERRLSSYYTCRNNTVLIHVTSNEQNRTDRIDIYGSASDVADIARKAKQALR